MMPCPCCGGMGVLLGTLADLDHWTCRQCGAEFSTPAEAVG